MRFIEYLTIIRPEQWYKNLVVFLAVFFSENLFNTSALWLSLLGFFSLCAVSSASYIINDIADKKFDQQNPEKKTRPIAAGIIPTNLAIIYSGVLFIAGIFLAYSLSLVFSAVLIVLFMLNQFYTFLIKHEIFADIIIISCNFVLRAISGAFLISVSISPWLVLCPFFLALFLATGKRHAEAILLESKSYLSRPVLTSYTPETTRILLIITTSLFIVSYALYALQRDSYLVYTLPFALYTILRQCVHIISGSVIARHPELAVKDSRMLFGVVLWVVSATIVLYF